MALGKDLSGLQARIGYRFRDVTLLETALTHSSFANELRDRGITKPSNERFEFLGDAVLQILVSEYLFGLDSKKNEGELTRLRAQIVCGKSLSKIASEISLGEYIHATDGKGSNDIRQKERVLAGSFEALVCAIYLDSERKDVGKEKILSLMRASIDFALRASDTDYKTKLKNLIEQEGSAVLEFLLTVEGGTPSEPLFTVECRVNNNLVGTGVATTKKEAEQKAACAALTLFGVIGESSPDGERQYDKERPKSDVSEIT